MAQWLHDCCAGVPEPKRLCRLPSQPWEKKHPSVYGLYHPKKVGNFGIVYSCFNNSECGKSLIMVDELGFPGHIFDNCQYQRSFSLYGASSHQLESEASLDLPATRQQTLTKSASKIRELPSGNLT